VKRRGSTISPHDTLLFTAPSLLHVLALFAVALFYTFVHTGPSNFSAVVAPMHITRHNRFFYAASRSIARSVTFRPTTLYVVALLTAGSVNGPWIPQQQKVLWRVPSSFAGFHRCLTGVHRRFSTSSMSAILAVCQPPWIITADCEKAFKLAR